MPCNRSPPAYHPPPPPPTPPPLTPQKLQRAHHQEPQVVLHHLLRPAAVHCGGAGGPGRRLLHIRRTVWHHLPLRGATHINRSWMRGCCALCCGPRAGRNRAAQACPARRAGAAHAAPTSYSRPRRHDDMARASPPRPAPLRRTVPGTTPSSGTPRAAATCTTTSSGP